MLKVGLTRSKNKKSNDHTHLSSLSTLVLHAGAPSRQRHRVHLCWPSWKWSGRDPPAMTLIPALLSTFWCLSWDFGSFQVHGSQQTVTTTSVSTQLSGSEVILLWLFNRIKKADCPKANLEGKLPAGGACCLRAELTSYMALAQTGRSMKWGVGMAPKATLTTHARSTWVWIVTSS